MRPALLLILTTCLLTNAVVLANDNELFKQLDDGNQAFAQAVVNKNLDYLVNDYTDDGCVIAPSTPRTCGKAALREFWSAVISSAPKKVEIATLAVGGSADLAHATGTLEITAADGTLHKNNYVLVLKRVTDSWKLHLDTWTPQ